MAKEPEQTEYNFKREMLAALPNLRAFAISLIRSSRAWLPCGRIASESKLDGSHGYSRRCN